MLARHEALEAWREGYRARQASLEPISVRLVLRWGAPLACYDPVHLDNLLAFAVAQEATGGQMLGAPPAGMAGWALPVPLAALWWSPEGFPLWASSVFWPCPSPGTSAVGDVLYWHKRMPAGRWTRGEGKGGRLTGMDGARGRWMERRTPLPVTLCDVWEARGWGDAAEIARLLGSIPFVGKRRAVGLGEVARWEVERTQGRGDRGEYPPAALLVSGGVLQRPVPVDAARALGLEMAEAPSLVGWTPPPWSPRLMAPGWRPGTRVHSPGGEESATMAHARAGAG